MCVYVINIILMSKRQKRKKKKTKQPYGYQPKSPLTIHYIITGAILPEKTKDNEDKTR